MKKIIFLLCITIIRSYDCFSMDDPDQIIPLNYVELTFEEKVLLVNTAIDNKHKEKMFQSARKTPSTRKRISILQIVESFQKNDIDAHFIRELCKENIRFMKTMNYFYELAKKNIEMVTCDTIETVRDYEKLQLMSELNVLWPSLKKFLIEAAYKNIPYRYEITFKGHTDTIQSTAINEHTGLAASASKDTTFRLWSLSNGKLLHIFPKKAYNGTVTFNDTGCRLATTSACEINPLDTHITVWDISSMPPQPLHEVIYREKIARLHFFPDKSETLLAIEKKGANTLSLFKIAENSNASFLGIIDSIITIHWPEKHGSEDDEHNWTILRNSPDLGLCQLALQNSKNKDALSKMMTMPIYKKDLTEYEQDILQKQLIKK